MLKYVLKRIIQSILTLLVISIIVFIMARISGDPLDLLVPDWAGPEMYEKVAKQYGLDQPYTVQYIKFIAGVFRGDFGTSFVTRQPIAPAFWAGMKNTFKLIIVSFPLAVLLSIPLAIIAATQAGRLSSKIVMLIVIIGQAAPAFFIGLVLMRVFSVQLGWFPAARMEGWKSYILPGFTTMIYHLAALTRILRNSLLKTMRKDFIKLARLKGLSERVVLWKHALRNSCIVMLTNAAQSFARLVVGGIVIESVFAWPGAGSIIYSGIMARDYGTIQMAVIVICAMMTLANLVVDILHGYIDPRIRTY